MKIVAAYGVIFACLLLSSGFFHTPEIVRCPRIAGPYELVSYKVIPSGNEVECHYIKHVYWKIKK